MMNFKLCYEIPTQKGTFIAPQLLTENQPEYAWDQNENLLLRYSYEFMPKGILTQFIVAMHPYILEHQTVWKSGVVIEKDGTLAEVIEYYGRREIHVRVKGANTRDLMTLIRYELKGIHDTYKRLKYDELIRCNCSTCCDSQEPHFYALATLLKFKADHQLQIQCQKSYSMVDVMGLLGDMLDLSRLFEKEETPNIYVQGDLLYKGEKNMSKITQTISNSTITGNVNAVAAKNIQDSFNTIQQSGIQEELKQSLNDLTKAVETMIQQLPEAEALKAAKNMKRLTEEATSEQPDSEWYSVSIDGLIKAAQNLGKVGDAVIELAGKVRKILTGGLL